jgi:hypothetical protein
MTDLTGELLVENSNFNALREVEERDNEIVRRRTEFKNKTKRHIEEISSPLVRRIGYGITPEQTDVLNGVVLDSVATFKIGKTSTETPRKGMHRGRRIVFDPLLEGWKERIKRSGLQNVDEAFKLTQDATAVVLSESPHLGVPIKQK